MHKKTDARRALLLRAAGLLLCVVPPAAATLSFFPLWRGEGAEAVLSGGVLLLLTLAALPLFRAVKKLLRSPAVWLLWLVLGVLFALLSRIADEMVVISFFGFLGNAAGALLFRAARRKEKHEAEL